MDARKVLRVLLGVLAVFVVLAAFHKAFARARVRAARINPVNTLAHFSYTLPATNALSATLPAR